jgi:hypothetical protein
MIRLIYLLICTLIVSVTCLGDLDKETTQLTSNISTTSDTSTCRNLFPEAKEIPAREYFLNLKNASREVSENPIYWYISPNGSVARNGPEAYWYWKVFLKDASTFYPKKFQTIQIDDSRIQWSDYQEYSQAVCDAVSGSGTRRQAQILHGKLLNFKNDWSGHASKWESFPYIETGASIIEAPSPLGLEHYTKYITGGGVIIVGGKEVLDEAFLAAREYVIYMTSAKPEFRNILMANEVRISLFGADNASILPEYKDESELGGFAMGMTDVSMTANANWLCWPDHWDTGGNPVIHEMVHTINHIVFEELNETYFYERIYNIAINSIKNGTFVTSFTQNLSEGQEQDISHFVGEFWAMTVEGYIMDKPGFKDSHDTRKWIAENDPDLFELITKYFPTEPWEYCKGVDAFYLGDGKYDIPRN